MRDEVRQVLEVRTRNQAAVTVVRKVNQITRGWATTCARRINDSPPKLHRFPARARRLNCRPMSSLSPAVFLAPFFLLFEIAQLVYAERFLGVKQIQGNVDPRQLGPGESVSALWVLGIVSEAGWLLWLLSEPGSRIHAACLLLVSLCGFALRSNCRLKWVLVILTVEGALRMGLMVSMLGSAWRAL